MYKVFLLQKPCNTGNIDASLTRHVIGYYKDATTTLIYVSTHLDYPQLPVILSI
jgi:hypothetical protein